MIHYKIPRNICCQSYHGIFDVIRQKHTILLMQIFCLSTISHFRSLTTFSKQVLLKHYHAHLRRKYCLHGIMSWFFLFLRILRFSQNFSQQYKYGKRINIVLCHRITSCLIFWIYLQLFYQYLPLQWTSVKENVINSLK